jgi:hypothetical protein
MPNPHDPVKKKKKVAGLIIAGTILMGGIYYWIPQNGGAPTVEAPEEFDVDVEDTGHKKSRLRIVPEYKVACLNEDSFTLNDIISEIEIDQRRGGANQECLEELKEEIEDKLDDEEFQDIPESERISEEYVTAEMKKIEEDLKSLGLDLN